MLKNMIHPFNKWWQFILANLGLGFLIIIFFNDLDTPVRILLGTLWAFLISSTQWLGHTYFQLKLSEKYNWLEHPVKRFIYTLFIIVFYSTLAFGVVQLFMNFIVFGKIPDYLLSFDFQYWGLPIIISLFIALIFTAISFLKSWKNEVVEKEKMKNEMLTYKYESLRNQINPHFMFNSLNVLSDLVYEDQKMAVNFIHKFSDIYRYVLDNRDKELVTVSEELAFVEKYIYLLKIRFEDKLQINIDIKNTEHKLIVPLALQLLIENSIKHNEVSTKNNLCVNVRVIDRNIEVSNRIKLKNIGENSKNIGLKNLAQQYSYFTDESVVVSEENNIFTVRIPLITESK